MRVLTDTDPLPGEWEASAVSIGAFDGVHLGHRALIGEMRARAELIGLASVVLTFDRHPAVVVRRESAPLLLTGTDQKLELLDSTGIDAVRIVTFDESRASQPPEEFVTGVLVEQLRARLVVVGSDFHFGKGRRGNLALLSEMGHSYGFGVEGVQLMPGGFSSAATGDVVAEPISSTRVRALVAEGKVEAAAALLGRDHEVRGTVEPGDGRGGTELGCPTANLAVADGILLPRNGIYAGWCHMPDGTVAPMVASIGIRPTYYRQASHPLLEVHILDFEGDLYGERLAVRFHRRLRDEVAFRSTEELSSQIWKDIEDTRRVLGT